MVIRISIESTEPLVGTAAAERGAPVGFVGWLELLRAISELVGAPGRSVDPSQQADEAPAQRTGRHRPRQFPEPGP